MGTPQGACEGVEVDVRELGAPPGRAREQVACLEQWHVEGAPVEGDEPAGPGHRVPHGERHRGALVGESAELRLHQGDPALDLPEVARADAPFEPADHRLRNHLEPPGGR